MRRRRNQEIRKEEKEDDLPVTANFTRSAEARGRSLLYRVTLLFRCLLLGALMTAWAAPLAASRITLVFTGEVVITSKNFDQAGALGVYFPRMDAPRQSYDGKAWLPRHRPFIAVPVDALQNAAQEFAEDCPTHMPLPSDTANPLQYAVFFVDGYEITLKGFSATGLRPTGKDLSGAVRLDAICANGSFDNAVDSSKADRLSSYLALSNAVAYTDWKSQCKWMFQPAYEGQQTSTMAISSRICVDGQSSNNSMIIHLTPLSGKGSPIDIFVTSAQDQEIDIGNSPASAACDIAMDTFLCPDYHVELPFDLIAKQPGDIHVPWVVAGSCQEIGNVSCPQVPILSARAVHLGAEKAAKAMGRRTHGGATVRRKGGGAEEPSGNGDSGSHWLTGDCPPLLVER